ncbi:site-specific tyrosine recombinase XerC [Variovorax sp. SRS16]|uniref:tyrosine-type recombinase/integrase n=1 Tax=Variovorax sp. SRS16 TaxID=282217 RepID=UPI0013168110|nr:integrase family protein [Variovorax sp. SRS16]VTU25099.1 site-specific tyrosine recombinase XerC [Variovorax sp. SRS16]
MAKISFTAPRVAGFTCPSDRGQAFLWDAKTPGLGLRVTPRGAPAFIFQGVYQGKSLRVTIGDATAWRIPDAQAKARELQRLIDEGRDPRAVKAEAIAKDVAQREAERLEAVTVGDVWPTYLAEGSPKRRAAWKPRYRADLEAMSAAGGVAKKRGKGLTRPGPLYPLLALPLADVNEDALKSWYDREAKAGKHQAARALMMFRGFLRWCSARPAYRSVVDRDAGKAASIVEVLPANTRRTDALEGAQLPGWWGGVEELGNHTASVYLRALLLTGARREELAALRWADIDFRWKKLTIADKVDATRTIPLTPYLGRLLATLPRVNDFVFASTSSKTGRIADTRASHSKALESAGIDGLTIHGLRRSFSLLGEAAGAPAGAIAQVMGHKPSATAEGYRPRSVDALRPFLSLIERHILEKAGVPFDFEAAEQGGGKVVSIHQKKSA